MYGFEVVTRYGVQSLFEHTSVDKVVVLQMERILVTISIWGVGAVEVRETFSVVSTAELELELELAKDVEVESTLPSVAEVNGHHVV